MTTPTLRWSTVWLVTALAVAAIVAPMLAPHAVDAVDLANRRGAPSLAHWFGTDELGRDVFTRVLHGGRVSLAIGIVSALVSVLIGTAIGATAGTARGWVDDLLMRATDAMLIVPRLPLLMILGAVLQPGIPMLILIVGAVGWMETARVVRATVMSIATRDYVLAATASGASRIRVVIRHVLPGVAPLIATATTLAVGRGILLESALSFFGVGVQPPAASWGNMLYQAQTTMTSEPWLALFPGAMIWLAVWLTNAVGDRRADDGLAARVS